MKKTAISLLLVLAMVASFVLTAAPVANAENTHPHGTETAHCACAGTWDGVNALVHKCETIAEGDWKPLNGNLPAVNSSTQHVLTSGNYYLTDDLQLGGTLKVNAGVNVTICLNGYQMTGRVSNSAAGRALDISGSVTITDCGNGGVIKARAGGAEANNTVNGGVVFLRAAGGILNVYGGELQYSRDDCYSKGAVIHTSANATINIYGGALTGANCVNGTGGVINVEAGTLNIHDGTLTGGKAKDGNGNSIYATAAATVNFNGGTIISGTDTGKTIVLGNDSLALNITKMGLEVAENGSVGVGYITEFTMTDGMKAKLTASDAHKTKEGVATSYGLKLWTKGGTPQYAGYGDQNATAVGAHLKNIMNINDNAVNDAANADNPVKGVAYAVIGKTVVESVTRSFTLKTLVQKMDANLTDNASLEILADLYELYETVMSGWGLSEKITGAAA